MINLDNFDSPSMDKYDINLMQKEVDGGTISIEQIDSIRNYPESKTIVISGLNQDTFEYFINTYGKQFRVISFWKNKKVSDLAALSSLRDIEFITYFHNQKANKLWDMTNNQKLVGLCISDFIKPFSLEGIEKACSLRSFQIYDRVYASMKIESFQPLVNTNIKHFVWGGNKVLDNNYECLADSKIEILDISPRRFTMSQLAQFLALFPETLKGSITKPYVKGGVKDKDGYKEYLFLCKGKKICTIGKDDKRFSNYLKEFEILLKNCRESNNYKKKFSKL